MTSVDPSLEPTTPQIVTDPSILRAAQDAGRIASIILGTAGVLSAAVMRANTAPAVYVRVQTLDIARKLAVREELAWHAQATSNDAGALYVHVFEGTYIGTRIPLTLIALGPFDPDPEVGTLDGPCGVAVVLAGTLL